MPVTPLKTFIIYARADEDYKKQLLLHLRPLINSRLLGVWHDGDIQPGEDWEKAIRKELKASELVIVLVSVHSLNSDFIQTEELRMALDQRNAGLNRVVPVLVSPCAWRWDPIISHLQALPLAPQAGLLPVSEWPNANLAWTSVVEQIGDMVQEIQQTRREAERDAAENRQRREASILSVETPAVFNALPSVEKPVESEKRILNPFYGAFLRRGALGLLTLALLGLSVFGVFNYWSGKTAVRAPGAYLKADVMDGAPVTADVIEYVSGNGVDEKTYFEQNLQGRCFQNPVNEEQIQRGTQITEAYLGPCAGVYVTRNLLQGSAVNDFLLVVPRKSGSRYTDNEVRNVYSSNVLPPLAALAGDPPIFLGYRPYCVKCGLTLSAEKDRLSTDNIEPCGGVYVKASVPAGTLLTDELLEEIPLRPCQRRAPDVVYQKKDILHSKSTRSFPAGTLLKFSDF